MRPVNDKISTASDVEYCTINVTILMSNQSFQQLNITIHVDVFWLE